MVCPDVPVKLEDIDEPSFLQSLMENMETYLVQPEDMILTQGHKGDYLYFIMQGDCTINIRDSQGKEHEAFKLLTEGDHFGEISLIYDTHV